MGLLKKIVGAFRQEPALELEVADKSGASNAPKPETPPKAHPSASIKVHLGYLGDGTRAWWRLVVDALGKDIAVEDANGKTLPPKKLKEAIVAHGVMRGEFWAARDKANRMDWEARQAERRRRESEKLGPVSKRPMPRYEYDGGEYDTGLVSDSMSIAESNRIHWRLVAEKLGVSSVDENGDNLPVTKIKSALYRSGATKKQIRQTTEQVERDRYYEED